MNRRAPTPRPPRTRPNRDAAGFTLLEVMVAMLVFLVGVVGVIGLFATGLAVHRDAMIRTRAALATDEARVAAEAEIRRLAASGELPETIGRTPLAGRPGWFWTAAISTDPAEGLSAGAIASVRVATMEGGREKGETFTVYVKPGTEFEALIREAKQSRGVSPTGK